MNKPKKIDLNKWEIVESIDELNNYQSMIITPLKLSNGVQLPDIYFRKGKPKDNEIEDVDNAEWFKDIKISKDCDDETYYYRVDWWYKKALENDPYRDLINRSFNKHGFDVRKSWEASQVYLKKMNQSARKTYLHKYVWNWLSSDLNKWIRTRR